MLPQFLSATDTHRASLTLRKLARHDIGRWTLTGGLAVEIHHLLRGRAPAPRVLNDIDFIAASFDAVPESLADDFLFLHVHPAALPGKTMIQFLDAETGVRLDLFRAYGHTLSRAGRLALPSGALQLISLEDLTARTARLALDLLSGVPTPAKHAADFERLAKLLPLVEVERAWPDHRKPGHPASIEETGRLLRLAIATRQDLLITPEYSKDPDAVCPRCESTAALHLADPNLVLSILGYR